MPETNELLEQISKLLKSGSKKSYEIAETDFRVGQLISEACRDQGEDVVSVIAASNTNWGRWFRTCPPKIVPLVIRGLA